MPENRLYRFDELLFYAFDLQRDLDRLNTEIEQLFLNDLLIKARGFGYEAQSVQDEIDLTNQVLTKANKPLSPWTFLFNLSTYYKEQSRLEGLASCEARLSQLYGLSMKHINESGEFLSKSYRIKVLINDELIQLKYQRFQSLYSALINDSQPNALTFVSQGGLTYYSRCILTCPKAITLQPERFALLTALPLTALIREDRQLDEELWEINHQVWEGSNDKFARMTNQALLLYQQLFTARYEAENWYTGLLTTTHFYTSGIAQTFLRPALKQLQEILEILLSNQVGKTVGENVLIESFGFPTADILQMEVDNF